METETSTPKQKKDVCPLCKQEFKIKTGIGFGAASKKTCGCKDPWETSRGTSGWSTR